jgi:Uma2 family endonuclease
MSATLTAPAPLPEPNRLPTHLDLPDTDGLPSFNAAEPRQTALLTESLRRVLKELHPDGKYTIGQDLGIYYRLTDPPLDGCKSPDWWYVAGVGPEPPDFPYRRSYVLWHELVPPSVLIEYVSDDTENEWDQTPNKGKFWVYEQVFRAQYYAIHTHATGELKVYHRVDDRFELMEPNERGRYPISTFGVELGTVRERLDGFLLDWLRWFDSDGNLLPSDEERAEQERLLNDEARRQGEDERKQKEEERKQKVQAIEQAREAEDRASKLAAKLREMGIDPSQI